jgi:hypothetical protein
MYRQDAYRQYKNENPWTAINMHCLGVIAYRGPGLEEIKYWIWSQGGRIKRSDGCTIYFTLGNEITPERKQTNESNLSRSVATVH